MIICKALWVGLLACGVASILRWGGGRPRCREIRKICVRFDLRKVFESLLDTRRERNIIVVINDDDFRRWGKV